MLPNYNNFYSFFEDISQEDLIHIMLTTGWKGHQSAWNNWKLSNEWSELTVEMDDSNLLLNGSVLFKPQSIKALNKLCDQMNCNYRFEFYDEKKNLLLEETRRLT